MRILLADDHALVRDALRRTAGEAVPEAVLIECESLDQALAAAESEAPIDLALLDIRMPGMHGVEGVRIFRDAFPNTPVAVLSGYFAADDIVTALDFGARGFIPKSLELEKVFEAIRMIVAGHHYIPAEILAVIETGQVAVSGDHSTFDTLVRSHALTQREQDALRLLVDGHTNKAIALRMEVQEVTVKLHLRKVYRKLGAKNRAQVVRMVLQGGWNPQATC
jgi:DNA-binding NarL/FixJ family response regulator